MPSIVYFNFNNPLSIKEETLIGLSLSLFTFTFLYIMQVCNINDYSISSKLIYIVYSSIPILIIAFNRMVHVYFLQKLNIQFSDKYFKYNILALFVIGFFFNFFIELTFKGYTTLKAQFTYLFLGFCFISFYLIFHYFKNKNSFDLPIDKLNDPNILNDNNITENTFKETFNENIKYFVDLYGKPHPIDLENTTHINSYGNYIKFFNASCDKYTMIRSTLSQTQLELSKYENIQKIHRTTLINLKFLKNIKKIEGKYYAELFESETLHVISKENIQELKSKFHHKIGIIN